MDIHGQGEILVQLTRRDPDDVADLDLVLGRCSAGGSKQELVVVDDDPFTILEGTDVVAHPLAGSRSLGFRGFGSNYSGVTHWNGGGVFSHSILTAPDNRFALTRQGDGKVVSVRNSVVGDGTLLQRMFVDAADGNDDTFLANVFDLDLGGDNRQETEKLLLSAGRPVLVGTAKTGTTSSDGFIARFANAYVFADGFESSNRGYWSNTQPAP